MLYLYQQSPPFWWLQNLNSLNRKLKSIQVFSWVYITSPPFCKNQKGCPKEQLAPPRRILPLALRSWGKSRYGMLAKQNIKKNKQTTIYIYACKNTIAKIKIIKQRYHALIR